MCKGGEGSISGRDLEQGMYMPELHSAWPTICIACKERRPEGEGKTSYTCAQFPLLPAGFPCCTL